MPNPTPSQRLGWKFGSKHHRFGVLWVWGVTRVRASRAKTRHKAKRVRGESTQRLYYGPLFVTSALRVLPRPRWTNAAVRNKTANARNKTPEFDDAYTSWSIMEHRWRIVTITTIQHTLRLSWDPGIVLTSKPPKRFKILMSIRPTYTNRLFEHAKEARKLAS